MLSVFLFNYLRLHFIQKNVFLENCFFLNIDFSSFSDQKSLKFSDSIFFKMFIL